jgi:hypothetical protein
VERPFGGPRSFEISLSVGDEVVGWSRKRPERFTPAKIFNGKIQGLGSWAHFVPCQANYAEQAGTQQKNDPRRGCRVG